MRKFIAGIVAVTCFFSIRPAYAVVGQAEHFDEVKEEDLKEFQEALVAQEKKEELEQEYERTQELEKLLKQKQKEKEQAQGEEKKLIEDQVKQLEKELLGLPKRDRLRFGLSGDYSYDSNANRDIPRHGKGDSIFNLSGNVEVDLSGRKTDLRAEFGTGRQWNIKLSERDFWQFEERLRYRRKYFKKITHSINSRVARTNEKTIEIDNNRIRWDSNQQTSLNYLLTRKLSLNYDFALTNRLFTQEAFDEDSSWQVTMSPSVFWNFTPKSRVSLGYTFGANRIRSKSGDTNSHGVNAGYFGKITNKSSASFDIGYSHQTPRSQDSSSIDTLTTGAGYIWQATPKTQILVQYIYSLQNSTTDVDPDTGTTSKETTYFYNNSVTVSINSRLTRKLTGTLNFPFSQVRTKTSGGADDDAGTQQFTLPIPTLSFTYLINRWARMRLAYAFSYRTGDEKQDMYRDHLFTVGLDLRF